MAWKFQFEYAGFIAAVEKGYYREAGIELELREYQDGIDVVSEVIEGRATYGVYNSSLVVEEARIRPVVLMATYYQRSPLVFVTRKGISNPADLIGKTIMGTKDELKQSSLALMLDHFGVSPRNSRFVDHTYTVDDFLAGKVDAMSAFRSNQLYYLDRAGAEYNVIDPADYGFVMSAVNLFTSRAEAVGNTERTRRFIEATNRGWRYAIEHPEEIIDLLLGKYGCTKTREALRYEAKVSRALMMTDFYPIGAANAELTVRTFKQLSQTGALRSDQKLERFLFSDIVAASDNGLSLTPAEKSYLLEKKKITMCVDPEWYPLEAIREGKHIGMAADVMQRFSKKLGIPIELVPTRTWEESLQNVRERKCDILSLSGYTPKRLEYIRFTSPYMSLPLVMVTDRDKPFTEEINTLKNAKVGVVRGYASLENLRRRYDGVRIVEVESINEGLHLVETGELYGYVDNLIVATSYIQKHYAGSLKVSSRLDQTDELHVGVRNDEPLLLNIFEKSVRNLDEEAMQGIYNRWVSTVEEVAWIDRELILRVLALAALVLLVFGWRYYELKRLNARLLELSITDKLTGLFNRQKTDERLNHEKAMLERHADYRTSVLLIDVDHFKTINDTRGHQVGDNVLCELAALFRENLRSSDVIGRWGGEEFIIILPQTGEAEAFAAAEHLREAVERHGFGENGGITISIGVAPLERALSVHENIAQVDRALYEAKRLGRNRVCCSGSASVEGKERLQRVL